jgi:hypothetical protein
LAVKYDSKKLSEELALMETNSAQYQDYQISDKEISSIG